MKTNSLKRGLAARQEALQNIKARHLLSCRVSIAALIFIGMMLVSSCQQTSNGQSKVEQKKEQAQAQDTVKPKVSISVNRHYDDKGNLTGFDSTYSSFYTNVHGDTSGLHSFLNDHRLFNGTGMSLFREPFKSPFFNDTLFRFPSVLNPELVQKPDINNHMSMTNKQDSTGTRNHIRENNTEAIHKNDSR
jgi:hypothetical protein